MHVVVEQVTETIRRRSGETRRHYLQRMQQTRDQDPPKQRLSCGNLAHGYAACNDSDKQTIRLMESANLGIVTSYNDMLSAHQPLGRYPDMIKQFARDVGSTAQVAGGVPAMCDGVIQGQPGMEMSLFSRDVIAMATALSLSHNVFDGVLCLGVCDKIVPGLLIGALQFGYLPAGFIPAGPMLSGIPNKEKAAVRQRYADGKASRDELLAAESASYHSPGTCTFYGTANSNQVLMEMLGVQLPGSSFVNPDNPLRPLLIEETVKRVIAAANAKQSSGKLCEWINEASLVNAVVALLATGGSTNHTLHLVAIAHAAGLQLTWQDFEDLSKVTPLLARVYPNGEADVNHFQQAGGMGFLVKELRGGGLLNENVVGLMGEGLIGFETAPQLNESQQLRWEAVPSQSQRPDVLRPLNNPFDHEGGIRLLTGNLGTAVVKISAVRSEHRLVQAPCVVFHDQDQLKTAFENGELNRDIIAVVRFQGPHANGMPELHKLTPYLGVLQDRGFKVALVTDGRMSGASGKVPAAIHCSPEALQNGAIGKLRDGDVILLDAEAGKLQALVNDGEWRQRSYAECHQPNDTLGRSLFDCFRVAVNEATLGATVFK